MRDPSIRRVTAATASAQSEVVVVAGRFVARRIVWRTSVAHRWSTWRPSGPVSVGASRGPLDRGIDLGRHVEPEPQRDGHVDGGVPGVRASTDVVVGAVADHHYFPVRACGGGCGRTKRAARATTWRLTTGRGGGRDVRRHRRLRGRAGAAVPDRRPIAAPQFYDPDGGAQSRSFGAVERVLIGSRRLAGARRARGPTAPGAPAARGAACGRSASGASSWPLRLPGASAMSRTLLPAVRQTAT